LTTVSTSLRLPATLRWSGRSRLLRVALLALAASGCAPDAPHRERREDTLTSGVLRIAAEPDVATLVRATADAFEAGYPDASISVEARTSREAMADVFANRADLAVIGREIEEIERQAATEAGLEMEAFRWARDGVAVLAHPSNPVNQVSCDDLRLALSTPNVSWAEFGGPDRAVVPVLPAPETGVAQYVARLLVEREDVLVPAVSSGGDSAITVTVRRTPAALGFVSSARLTPGVKVLAVSRAQGMPYVELDKETVYLREYPLTRSFQIVSRIPGVKLGGGFVTFATSDPGQRLVRDHGFVPATVPVNFTRRLPAARAH
jgi:phosphate transport system substrate-binding protein